MKAIVVYLLGMFLFGFSSFAFAEAKGVFFLSAGDAEVERENNGFSGNDTAFKIGSGFRVTESAGIELFYANYGAPGDTLSFPTLGARKVEVEVYSLAFQYVHFLPVASTLDLYARLGFAFWKSELAVLDAGLFNDDGIGVIGGLGAEIDVMKSLAVRLEWEYSVLDDYDVNFISVGIAHYFD